MKPDFWGSLRRLRDLTVILKAYKSCTGTLNASIGNAPLQSFNTKEKASHATAGIFYRPEFFILCLGSNDRRNDRNTCTPVLNAGEESNRRFWYQRSTCLWRISIYICRTKLSLHSLPLSLFKSRSLVLPLTCALQEVFPGRRTPVDDRFKPWSPSFSNMTTMPRAAERLWMSRSSKFQTWQPSINKRLGEFSMAVCRPNDWI